jgi:hypothetical protein
MAEFVSVNCMGYAVEMAFEFGFIRIKNGYNLKWLLNRNPTNALEIARIAKAQYRSRLGYSFLVSDLSLAIEIVGHVVPGEVADVALDYESVLPDGIVEAC